VIVLSSQHTQKDTPTTLSQKQPDSPEAE